MSLKVGKDPVLPVFGLVDCNHFYGAVERVFRPDLANTPIVVLSSNDLRGRNR